MRKPIQALLFEAGCVLAILGCAATEADAAIYRISFSGTQQGSTKRFSGKFEYDTLCPLTENAFKFTGTSYVRKISYALEGMSSAPATDGPTTDPYTIYLSLMPNGQVFFQLVGTCPQGTSTGSVVHIDTPTLATSTTTLPAGSSFIANPVGATFTITNNAGTETFYAGNITRFTYLLIGYSPGELIPVTVMAASCQPEPRHACLLKRFHCLGRFPQGRSRTW